MLLTTVIGSGIMGERLSGGNVAVALLATRAIEEPCSKEAINEVGRRNWGAETTVWVLRAVGKFVPPVQELWHDAGGARKDIIERSTELTHRVAEWLREYTASGRPVAICVSTYRANRTTLINV